MNSFKVCWCSVLVLLIVCLLAAAGAARRLPRRRVLADLLAAASGHRYGRVQMKVYRGPDDGNHGHDHFAPHGYWVKQPADDRRSVLQRQCPTRHWPYRRRPR